MDRNEVELCKETFRDNVMEDQKIRKLEKEEEDKQDFIGLTQPKDDIDD